MNRIHVALTAACGLAILTGCGTAATPAATPSATESAHDHESHEHESPSARKTVEAAGPTPRLAFTYDGGVQVIDAKKGEKVAAFPLDGFTRLNQAGDGRRLLVTEGQGFRVLDMGAWTRPHGDHTHSNKTEPLLTDITFDGKEPGHAVTHGGRTALFYDGEGRIEWYDPTTLSDEKPHTHQVKLPQAHHGVAVFREDDSLIHTIGDEKSRNGLAIQDKEGKTIAQNTDCPGVHGEAAVKDAITVGCEDGLLIAKGNTITKVKSPDAYGRIGNQFGSPSSTVVLGDYKVDKDAELERPTRVTLTDTATGKLQLVDVKASYSFRSLGRGAKGEALVLGTDGTLRVIDPTSAKITAEIPVTKAWTEPVVWQEPRPTLFVQGEQVWVSEPAAKKLHSVDLASKKVDRSITVDQTPNELNGIAG
ncbi:zinc metallochaperone AztD [Luteococcus sp. OSA5]|uniref:zinc metallochaperone AztD n=1 Tax=Luteococcus sp. OSA5 TaxID=3401630 RepID=UPI003B430D55